MNSPRPLLPPAVSARPQSFGPAAFGFGPRVFVTLLVGFLWLLPAWWWPRLTPAMFLWDGLVLLAFLTDLAVLPKPAEFEVRRSWEHPPLLGTSCPVTLTVHNLGHPTVLCTLTDQTPASLRKTPPVLALVAPNGQRATVTYTVVPRERGELSLGCLYLRYSSQYAFAERWAVADLRQNVCVLPDLHLARQQALYLVRSRQVEMERRRRRQRGLGREFLGLREYRPGDDFRDLCWTATARRNQLMTRLFEAERSQAVWILLDAGRLLRAEIQEAQTDLRLAKIDYAVNAALALAEVAVQSGDRVGLLAYGRNLQQNVAPGRGPAHLRTLVDCLAHVAGESAEADHARAARFLLSRQSRRSLVFWLTDFAETPTVPEVIECALGVTERHLVVFAAINQPDLTALVAKNPETSEEMYRHTAAVEIALRRKLLLGGLRRHGVFAFELAPGGLASRIVNQYLEIKERSLL